MLKLILNGTIGKDAEIKSIGEKKAIKFDVAVSMDYKDSNGNKVERTEWVKAVIWRTNTQSTKVADFIKKGQRVLIEGTPGSEGFQNKEGQVKTSLNITVKDLEFLN